MRKIGGQRRATSGCEYSSGEVERRMKAPEDWHAYMSYFGCWCSSFGPDVRITFVHESFMDYKGYSTTLRFMLSPVWPSWTRARTRQDGHTVYSIGLRELWPRRHEAKAIVAKGVMANFAKSIPFVSLPVFHRSRAGNALVYKTDLVKISKLFNKYPYLIGSWEFAEQSRPAVHLDIRVAIRTFRKIINYIPPVVACGGATGEHDSSDLLHIVLASLWKMSDWRDIIEGSSSVLPLAEISGETRRYYQVGGDGTSGGTCHLVFRVPTCILWTYSTPLSAVFRFTTGEIVRVSWCQHVNAFSPTHAAQEEPWEEWIKKCQGVDLLGLSKFTVNPTVKRNDFTIPQGPLLGVIEVVCEYEGGGTRPQPSTLLKEVALVWLMNLCFSRQGINNSVMAGVSLGDWETRAEFSDYIEELNPLVETGRQRLERLYKSEVSPPPAPETPPPARRQPTGEVTALASTPNGLSRSGAYCEDTWNTTPSTAVGQPGNKFTIRLELPRFSTSSAAWSAAANSIVKDSTELRALISEIKWFRDFCLDNRRLFGTSDGARFESMWSICLKYLSNILRQKCNEVIRFLEGNSRDIEDAPWRDVRRCNYLYSVVAAGVQSIESVSADHSNGWTIEPDDEVFWAVDSPNNVVGEDQLRSILLCLMATYPTLYNPETLRLRSKPSFERKQNFPPPVSGGHQLYSATTGVLVSSPPTLYSLLSFIMENLSNQFPLSNKVENAMEIFLRKIVKPCVWAPLILHHLKIRGPSTTYVPRLPNPESPKHSPLDQSGSVHQNVPKASPNEPWYTRMGRRRYFRKKLDRVAIDLTPTTAGSQSREFEEGECI